MYFAQQTGKSTVLQYITNNQRDRQKHLYYYRDNNGKEIDLLVVHEYNIYPVEIKKRANSGKNDIKKEIIIFL